MASLKEIRTRITSVKSTRQITSAMKMVSAAKLRKAQDYIIRLRPYANKLSEILAHLSESLSIEDNPYGETRSTEKVLMVVFTSNRGLCGSFNANVVKTTLQQLQEKHPMLLRHGHIDFYCIGKKGADLLKSRKTANLEIDANLLDNIGFNEVLPLTEKIMSDFIEKKYDRVYTCYNEFINAGAQRVRFEQFLPVEQPEHNENTEYSDYIFEPSKTEIITDLIPRSLKISFYKTLLDSNASEHGARMTAMHQATDNATELIKSLTLEYNKARQAAITKEISEIVGGAEALRG